MRVKPPMNKKVRTRPFGVDVTFSLPLFCRRLGEALKTPFSDPGQLVERPLEWGDDRAFAISYLFSEILSKYDDGRPSPEKEATTWQRFEAAERSCFEVNQRLAVHGLSGRHQSVILRAREQLARLLGDFSWDDCEPYMGWGPGASTRLPRRKSDAAYKFSGKPETTAGNAILGYVAICRVPSWKRDLSKDGEEGLELLHQVPGNRIITVPKNYKTDRTIAIEPCMNMYVQKGIGGVIRRKLRRWGCNLNDQAANQGLAFIGSVTGEYATIDLSMASDTISREVVSHMFPSDWVSALEQSRSQFGVLPSGEKIFYQKFSSMGNGFTFELESLLFLALARACCRTLGETERSASVYGDDLIVPVGVSELLCEVLADLGFTPNRKKTFCSGPFRESCGKHYFAGQDVTPFYVRKPVKRIDRLFLLHNNLWRWNERLRLTIGEECYEGIQLLLSELRSLAPSKWRQPRLPDGYGDGAFIGPLSSLTLCRHKCGWEYWTVRALVTSKRELECELPGIMLKSLNNLERRASDQLSDPSIKATPSEGGRIQEIKILIPQFPLA